MQVVRQNKTGYPSDRSIDIRGLHQTVKNVISRVNSQMSVVSTLATSYDLRYCKDSSGEGEMMRLVFTELLTEYPHTRRWLATLFYAFAAT